MSIDLRYLLSPKHGTASFILPYLTPADVERINTAFGHEVVAARDIAFANIVSHNTLSLKQLTDWNFADLTSLCPLRIEIDCNGFCDGTLQNLLQVEILTGEKREVQSRFPNASSLRFSAFPFRGFPLSLSFLQYCPHLKSLKLDSIHVDLERALEYFSHVPLLEELSLEGSSLSRHLAAIVPKLPHLKRLNLRHTVCSLEPLATTHLEWLDISEGYRDKTSLQFLPQTLKVLIAKRSTGILPINDSDLETIVQRTPYLEELEIHGRAIRSLAPITRLTQLRILNISCCFHKRLTELYPLQNLRSLILSGWPLMRNAQELLPEICAMFPNLSYLQVNAE